MNLWIWRPVNNGPGVWVVVLAWLGQLAIVCEADREGPIVGMRPVKANIEELTFDQRVERV